METLKFLSPNNAQTYNANSTLSHSWPFNNAEISINFRLNPKHLLINTDRS